uniref:Myb related transcription factor, partner of profilin n=1 Tax=Pongo abelii TaxID=9601 RepID=A0A8I5TNG6_PONAB
MASAAAGEAEETTRLRKPRFSFEENQILIREVRAHYPQLYGAQSRRVSVAERRRVWDGIAAKINGITSWKRTGQEVQKRWNDFKRRTKEKLARVPHSTQGAGPAAEDAFSAEEETIFAILGPGVAAPGAGAGAEEPPAAPSSQPPPPSACPQRYVLSEDRREDRRADTSAHSKGGSSSPEPWARPSCTPQEGGCPRPKERESPPPSALHPVQLPRLALSPPPPAPPLPPPLPLAQVAPSPPNPSLDFLRAQQETANAIRELAGTLRQGLAKLSEALSALLPLLPGTPVDSLPPPLPPPPPHPTSQACPAPTSPQGGDHPRARVRGGCCGGRGSDGSQGSDHCPKERGGGAPATPSPAPSARLPPTQAEKRFPYTEKARPMEISMKSTMILPAPPLPSLAQSRGVMLSAHPSCTLAPCSRDVSTHSLC